MENCDTLDDDERSEKETEKESENQHHTEKGTERGVNTTDYPVDVCMSARNPTRPIFVFKISDQTNKCYKFVISNGQNRGADLFYWVVCSRCHSLKYKSTNGNFQPLNSIKCDGYQLFSDPMTNHLAGCVAFDYNKAIIQSPLVTEEVKAKIIRGDDISVHLFPYGSPFPKPLKPLNDYPVEIVMNAKKPLHPQFIYRLPDCPSECYRFHAVNQRRSNTDFVVRCAGCASVYDKEKRLSGNSPPKIARRTDGRRMLSDPLLDHLAGCKTYDYAACLKKTPLVTDTVKEGIIEGEDISMFLPPNGTPFAAIGEASSSNAEDSESVQSGGLMLAVGRRKRKRARVSSESREKDASLGDAGKSVNDEDLMNYAALLASYLLTVDDDVTKKRELEGGSSQSAVPLDNVALEEDLVTTSLKGADATVVKPVNSVVSDPPRPVSCPVSSLNLQNEDLPPNDSVEGITMDPSKMFEKKFDSLDFNEEEVDVSVVDGKRLKVVFEKKTPLSSHDSRTFIVHGVKLPDYVDIDSITSSWEDNCLVVRASVNTPIS